MYAIRSYYDWFLLVSGYRTYRFLPVYSELFYPRFDKPTPGDVQALMHRMAEARFNGRYDPQSGIVRLDTPSVITSYSIHYTKLYDTPPAAPATPPAAPPAAAAKAPGMPPSPEDIPPPEREKAPAPAPQDAESEPPRRQGASGKERAESPAEPPQEGPIGLNQRQRKGYALLQRNVITSYSIHYTKLYDGA